MFLNRSLLVSQVAFCMLLLAPMTQAQITLPGGTVLLPGSVSSIPKICEVHACFKDEAVKKQFESQNNCKFVSKDLCGDKPLDTAKQCCGKDATTGNAKVKNKQATQLDPNFDWPIYQKECPNMRQSEAPPDSVWQQCTVGQRQNPATDDWPILVVKQNATNPNARPYCIDGCSTPKNVVDVLYSTGIFLVENKDNPTGYSGASFLNACSNHDICYQTCGASFDQTTCDNKLLTESFNACEIIPRDLTTIDVLGNVRHTYSACKNAANKMNTGLYLKGKAAFLTRKQQYCQCC